MGVMRMVATMAMTTILAACGSVDDPVAAHKATVEAWSADRIARLTQPDGWLALVGLHWLKAGRQRVGCADDNDVALAVGPDHLGELVVADSHATFVPLDGLRFTVDGKPGTGPVALIADSQGEPTVIGFAEGRASFMAVERGGRLALRVRDAKAVTRTGFKGIPRYPVDIGWRLEARFEAHPPGTTLPVASVINTVDEMANPGVVVFEKDGRTFRLEAVDEGDGRLFLVFGDRSNGRETYGAGRFLYAAPADANGRTIVDFNEAYNPPCAMNAFSTCPLPPPENRLDLLVNAGELKYEGIGH